MNDGILIWSPGMTLDIVEKMIILKAYSHFKNNKTATAGSLGIAIRTLDAKLDRYKMEQDQEEKRKLDDQARREAFLARQRGNPPNNVGLPHQPQIQKPVEATSSMHNTQRGVRMESAAIASAQPEVSMSQREEVQAMLSSSNPKGNRIKKS